jgi:hypothetical protein
MLQVAYRRGSTLYGVRTTLDPLSLAAVRAHLHGAARVAKHAYLV